MNDITAQPSRPDSSPPSGPPWINVAIHQQMRWRDGDIVVSVPPKSGTTWMMNIVHQLRTGGDPSFEDVYAEVPWLEFVERPGQRSEELLARWDALPAAQRRAFKTHAAPPLLPYIEPSPGRPDLKYVVVLRNPEEAAVSLKPFLARHSPAHFAQWKVPGDALVREEFSAYYDEIFEGKGLCDMLFGFMAAWWPLRAQPNVLMIHFGELKRDYEGSLRKVADFLGFAPSEAQWTNILEYCSFPWMKAHQDKFELAKLTDVPVLVPGAMIRKGQVGAAGEDGMTQAIAARLRARGATILEDPRALDWHYHGGPLPPVERG